MSAILTVLQQSERSSDVSDEFPVNSWCSTLLFITVVFNIVLTSYLSPFVRPHAQKPTSSFALFKVDKLPFLNGGLRCSFRLNLLIAFGWNNIAAYDALSRQHK